MSFSIVLVKATRPIQLHASGINDLKTAIQMSCDLYDENQLKAKASGQHTNTATVVMTDEAAQKQEGQYADRTTFLHQAGGY